MTLKLDIALTGQTVSAHILFHLLNISFNIKFRVLRQTLPYFKNLQEYLSSKQLQFSSFLFFFLLFLLLLCILKFIISNHSKVHFSKDSFDMLR